MPSLRRALLILPVWCFCVIWMWTWWLTPSHTHYSGLFIPMTLAMIYEFTVLPSFFLYFVIKAKKPPRKMAPKGKKVAVISLCVPSRESFDIVENQLKAMSEITYPHDSWILDEGGSTYIKNLARQYGVKYFARKGVRRYNQPKPPFQKKTKAGNVNAWLEHVKWRHYDYFVQLDIDHIPRPNYLSKTLGYFKDPEVAWVQAPSVYKNLDHWTARGAAEQELVLQGPLQMGFYGHSEVPFIIGSHCTYRMSAIREIGGFQPTRAEDHLDTVYLAHHGYKGVFLPEIIAEGDGPETLTTYLAQQFAWAYSMFQVLMGHTPKLIKVMPWKRRWQFLFAQTWYPLWSLSYLTLFICPLLALFLNQDIAAVDRSEMFIHFMPLFVSGFLVWWAARPLMQPSKLRLSWRGIVLHAVRWPIIFRAIIAALFKIKKPYMITPKGKYAHTVPQLKTYRPFLLLGLLSALTVVVTSAVRHGHNPEAQMIFALSNTGFMLTICAVDMGLRMKQLKPRWQDIRLFWLKPIGATVVLALVFAFATYVPFSSTAQQLVYAQRANQIIVEKHPVNNEMSTEELVQQIRLTPPSGKPVPILGMYNPTFETTEPSTAYIQHSFVDWRDSHYLALAVAHTLQAGNTPLVTIEPRGENDGQRLLQNINSGMYDQQLESTAAILRASNNPVYIRFAHEMELADLYPWGNQDPKLYISAYKHVASKLDAGNPNIRMVWSPAGNAGAEVYYPGDETVDVIGTTILYDEYWYGKYVPSFAFTAATRQQLGHFGKPVWVVEFGSGNANPASQKQFINDALNTYQALGFKSLIYLNLKDANIAGPDYRLPSVNDFGNFYSRKVIKRAPKPVTPKQEKPKNNLINERRCDAITASLGDLSGICIKPGILRSH